MNSGKYRSLITVQKQSTSDNSFGEFVEKFGESFKRWAAIEPLNGREFFAASGANSEVTTRISLRHDSQTCAITSRDRINHGGTVYEITSPVINPRMKNSEIVLMCKVYDREH